MGQRLGDFWTTTPCEFWVMFEAMYGKEEKGDNDNKGAYNSDWVKKMSDKYPSTESIVKKEAS